MPDFVFISVFPLSAACYADGVSALEINTPAPVERTRG
jgi:hypothetical protein